MGVTERPHPSTLLGKGEVHLWRARLDVSPRVAHELGATLTSAERARAARLRDRTARARFVSSRGWLRHLLADYVGADAPSLTFSIGAHGKPALDAPSGTALRFNLAHSAGVVVFAVARDREVGVDVERIRHDVDVDAVSRRYFTDAQRLHLTAAPAATRTAVFFATWTRLEACMKATGLGVAGTDHARGEPDGYTVRSFDAGRGYAAAVAVEGDDVPLPSRAATLSLASRPVS